MPSSQKKAMEFLQIDIFWLILALSLSDPWPIVKWGLDILRLDSLLFIGDIPMVG